MPPLTFSAKNRLQPLASTESTMQLDDLIGLLFFVFFVILPALSGLFRRGQQPPDLDEPQIPRPGPQPQQPRPQPPQSTQQTPQPQRLPQPAQRPAQPAQRPQPAQPRPAQTPRPAQRPEPRPVSDAARRLETHPSSAVEYTRQQAEQARRDQARQPARPPQPTPPVATVKKATPQPLLTDKDAILKGMIWRQILEEPRGKHWRRSWSAGRRRRRPRI